LNKAEKYAVSSRKMKMILAGVGILVLLIIILVIAGELGAFGSG
jgi:t-SNARE complex subunit (syntaxin)